MQNLTIPKFTLEGYSTDHCTSVTNTGEPIERKFPDHQELKQILIKFIPIRRTWEWRGFRIVVSADENFDAINFVS